MTDNSVRAAAISADPVLESPALAPNRWEQARVRLVEFTQLAVDIGGTSRGRAGYLASFITIVCGLLLIAPGASTASPSASGAVRNTANLADGAGPVASSPVHAGLARGLTPLEREVRVSRVRQERVDRAHLARVRAEIAQASRVRAAKLARLAHVRAVARAHARARYLARLQYRLARVRVLPIWRSYRIGEGFGVHGWHWGGGIHTGIDLDVPIGTHVHAAMAGVVLSAHWEGSYGNCIRIRHYNGVVTRYAHLSKLKVKVGQYVQAGAVIANSGNTGNTTGPHLHFEVIVHGVPVNPRNWLR